ncbi:MAG: isoprenylcysteine carboxylmethyltransferase family protein [Crocinitomicaceae bacterium]|jgi:protein-S-isoprenylcysteine O-methyltransferase Ste14|nr:isoprenylcysteine carboxylmethyltransferase family protein [Crocinitomicaceae bacterium]MDP4724296.1 isoprenylcysteine carboxylmethyltransferase family protein [Crocinitomicaceae bacterium]MDP4738634.1 isoprenylcysteine carboxylmethyltransferase family protein [Crocinitomicaceae bacterium]MDP4798638.1 isoprenylcysteine carboxylmethyltransferase family protein [Crocinitomicaceae bacterium]MDP4806085.1 isoprenylcysteine carboxylmethyltransferase family protein [Crocinitomicaceae bacterium]
MSAQNQLEKLGNQFFKYRGQIPVLFFLVAFILMHFFPMPYNWLNPNYTNLAIGLVVLGHVIRALAVGKRAAHTSGRNRDEQVAEALNSTGIYSMVRHPLYLGNITTYIGWAVFTGIDWLVPVFLILFVAYYRLIIYAEEQFLTRKFGQDYLDWRKQTPLLLPAFWKYKANPQPFSIKVVLENEYSGWAASMTTAFVLLLFQTYILGGLKQNQNALIGMALFIVVFGYGMRYLKKKTRVFKVD